MNKKSILSWAIWIIIFSVLFGYSLVFAWSWKTESEYTKIMFKLSNNIYLDSLSLSKTKILFKSNNDLSKYKIDSKCNIFSKLSYSKWDYYMFDLKFFDNDCNSEKFNLTNDKNEIASSFKLKFVTEYWALSKMLDLNNARLIQLKNVLNKKILSYSKYEKYNRNIENNYYIFLENNRILDETIYNLNFINNILSFRDKKYAIAVKWWKIDLSYSKIPNAWRPYRSDYTDWIHHWWDVAWWFGEETIAIDDWIIVRVISEYSDSNLDLIKRGANLSDLDKTKNLDILRWKQVWLKTMKWEVIFYSHLDDVFSNIKVWEVVRKWQPLWTIWITWIPAHDYDDYHIHFPIQKNPYNIQKAGTYDFVDYMTWDWLFKGETNEYIFKNWDTIFEN